MCLSILYDQVIDIEFGTFLLHKTSKLIFDMEFPFETVTMQNSTLLVNRSLQIKILNLYTVFKQQVWLTLYFAEFFL